jgi:biuret amidohydrolase
MASRTLQDLIGVKSTALVLQEVQNGVIGGESAFRALTEAAARVGVIKNAARLAAAARAAGVPVIHATAENLPNGFGANRNARLFAAALKIGARNAPGTESVRPVPEVYADGDLVLPRYHGLSPMADGQLDTLLRNTGITSVVVVGVSLNVAVTNLAFDAVNRSYQVIVPADAVAGTPVEYGEQVIENCLRLISTVVSTDEIVAAWTALLCVGFAEDAAFLQQGDHAVGLLPQHGDEFLVRGLAVAGLERPHDGPQAALVDAHGIGNLGEEVTGHDGHGHQAHRRADPPRAGQVHELPQELDVEPAELVRIRGGLHGPVDLGQLGDLLDRSTCGRAEGAVAVDAAEELVVVARRVLVEADHERAAVRLDHHPALAVQGDDRLADGDAADAQLGGDFVLGDPVAHLELALEDLSADVVGDLLRACRAEQPVRQRVSTFEGFWQSGSGAGDGGLLDTGVRPHRCGYRRVFYLKQSISSACARSA